MHPAVHHWARLHCPELPSSVLEIGGADVNGGVRSFFQWSAYTAVDLEAGPGVDVVADFAEWAQHGPGARFALIVCLEVLEHTPRWPEILAGAFRLLGPGGLMVGTCASTGRTPHGARGAPEPGPGEWYENVAPGDLCSGLAAAGFTTYTVDVTRSGLDVRWVATR